MPLSLHIWDKLPPLTQKKLVRLLHPVRFGTLRHTTPLSSKWGKDRGTPLDRFYIEQFLQQNRQVIRGRVLEVGDRKYTDQFDSGVETCDVLDNNPANAKATFRIDLERAEALPSEQFDCLVLTQVLQFVYNLRSCIANLHRSLRPGGVLLATVPCVSRIDPSYGMEKDYWRFTRSVCRTLFGEAFGADSVNVRAYGNVLVSIAFLAGVATEELSSQELEAHEDTFQFLIAVKAVKR